MSNDTSDIVVTEGVAHLDLPVDDDVLRLLTLGNPAPVDEIPGLRYWAIEGERRSYKHGDNLVGHQQRAFEYYWALRAAAFRFGIGMSLGSGAIFAPSMLMTDTHNGESPEVERYGEDYGYSHLHHDAGCPKSWTQFFGDTFSCVISNHQFEHMDEEGQRVCLEESCRVVCDEGFICILQPDMTYHERGSIDPTHKNEWSADGFHLWLLNAIAHSDSTSVVGKLTIAAHNNLQNDFSFETVLQVHK